MNINKIQSTNFKSTYPVVHWLAESNSSYAPVAGLELTKKLQQKLVRTINKPSYPNNLSGITAARIKEYLKLKDIDFRNNPIVRSFYDRQAGGKQGFTPISYMISGDDVQLFENVLAKDIGRAKGMARDIFGTTRSAESMNAIITYIKQGLNFVNNKSRRIKDSDGIKYALHTKFETVRNKSGKIKDYRLVDVRFLPERGSSSPLERYKNM